MTKLPSQNTCFWYETKSTNCSLLKIATETHLEEAGVVKSRQKRYLCLHVCTCIFKICQEGPSVFIVHATIIHFLNF